MADAAATTDLVIDGPEAVAILEHAGLIERVTRPDGTVGCRPIGDLVQFDKHAQTRLPFAGRLVTGGAQIADLGGLAYEERPDGTFDAPTIIVGTRPVAPRVDALPVAAPSPPSTEPSPAGPSAADTRFDWELHEIGQGRGSEWDPHAPPAPPPNAVQNMFSLFGGPGTTRIPAGQLAAVAAMSITSAIDPTTGKFIAGPLAGQPVPAPTIDGGRVSATIRLPPPFDLFPDADVAVNVVAEHGRLVVEDVTGFPAGLGRMRRASPTSASPSSTPGCAAPASGSWRSTPGTVCFRS
jgi:hypothetical protein